MPLPLISWSSFVFSNDTQPVVAVGPNVTWKKKGIVEVWQGKKHQWCFLLVILPLSDVLLYMKCRQSRKKLFCQFWLNQRVQINLVQLNPVQTILIQWGQIINKNQIALTSGSSSSSGNDVASFKIGNIKMCWGTISWFFPRGNLMLLEQKHKHSIVFIVKH